MPPPLSRNATSDPSQEIVSFFVRRTNEHIDRVRRCLALMASVSEHGVELNERGRIHDASKFGPAERIPYIWLTAFHRCRNDGVPFTYPDGMLELVRAAIKRLTETYYFLECQPEAKMQLNEEAICVQPGDCVMIRPGTRHRAIGRMKVFIVVYPKFDEADEWFD